MFVNSALRDLRFELYYTQSFQYLGTLKMDESTIFESAGSSRNAPPSSGTRDEPVNRSARGRLGLAALQAACQR